MIGELYEATDPKEDGFPNEILGDLVELIPFLQMRSIDQAPEQIQDRQAVQQQVIEAFIALCTPYCNQHPLMLFMDEVHWADTDTLVLLRNLARHIRSLPILFVLTYRESELGTSQALQNLLLELNRERLTIHLGLQPLDHEETRDLTNHRSKRRGDRGR